ncbi:MAG: hypothetical protein IH899_19190 [Planctomycetes bacterium]|nr:hypothetical protein [Planctomycetota bacterium]
MDRFSSEQVKNLSNVAHQGTGRAGKALSSLIGEQVELSESSVEVRTRTEIEEELSRFNNGFPMLVTQDFHGKISGRAGLFFRDHSGTNLAHLLMEEDEISSETQDVLFEILLEVGNIVLNGVMGSLSNMARDQMSYSIPRISVGPEIIQAFSKVAALSGDNECANLVLKVDFNFAEHQIQGSLFVVFDLQTVRSIIIEQLFA